MSQMGQRAAGHVSSQKGQPAAAPVPQADPLQGRAGARTCPCCIPPQPDLGHLAKPSPRPAGKCGQSHGPEGR